MPRHNTRSHLEQREVARVVDRDDRVRQVRRGVARRVEVVVHDAARQPERDGGDEREAERGGLEEKMAHFVDRLGPP